MRPSRFHGGLRLAGHKAESTADALRPCPPPPVLRLSLAQHAGRPARACVAVGDNVRRGQLLGQADGELSAGVHAPRAGRIQAITAGELPGFPGLATVEVWLTVQGDDAVTLPPLDGLAGEPSMLRERIRAAGVVGLGGAGFPTAEKLAVGRELLILNGAECEPWIACDDALLREHADEVVLGGRLLARAVGAGRILLAVEDSMTAALDACRRAIDAHGDDAVELAVVPTIYPEGGERQLILALTGREVPRGGLPRDLGVVVQNVATARAAWRAVVHGEALIERIVTVTGPGVVRPGNYVVPLGTTVAHLVAQAGGYTADAARLLLGGPMMGLALPHDDVPLGKTHNCVLVQSATDVAAETREPELPCIRCGDCAPVCPARLLPQQLLWQVRAGRLDRAVDQGLFDCIECGCCDLACPSHIPLTAHFRHGKGEQRVREAEAQRAEAARTRHESRQQRLEREAAERAARDAARRDAATSSDAVAAALERARARRGDPGTSP
jgi:electron transport complex protein RnfC